MKKTTIILLMGIMATTSVLIKGKDFSLSWKKVESLENKDLPSSALQESEKLSKEAKKKNLEGDLVLAWFHRAKNLLLVDCDSCKNLLVEGEQILLTLKSPQIRSIMKAMMVNLYLELYDRGQSHYPLHRSYSSKGKRTLLEYDAKDYYEQIQLHINDILKEKEALLHSNTDPYLPLLEKGNEFRGERPTLHDLLMNRIIEWYAYSSLPELENLVVGTDPSSWREKTNALYEELIQNNLSNPATAFAYRVEKLIYNEEWEKLDTLIEQNKDKEYILPAFIKKLNHDRGFQNKLSSKKLIPLCEELLSRFKKSPYIDQLHNLYIDLTSPKFSLPMKEVYHPEDSIQWRITSSFLSQYTLSIYKIPDAEKDNQTLREEDKDLSSLLQEKVFSRSITTPQEKQKESWEYTLSLPPNALKEGAYLLILTTPEGKEKNFHESFIVSRFATMKRRLSKDTNQLFVLDRESGHPVQNASIVLYKKGENKDISTDTLLANPNGVVEIPYDSSIEYWRPIRGNDCSYPLASFSTYYYAPSKEEREVECSSIFTDRSIYRCGQSIQFKGILWKQKEGKTFATERKNIKVSLYDANHKEVLTKECTSNAFGSFSGEFLIPEGRLLGSWRIETNCHSSSFFEVAEYKRPTFKIEWKEMEEEAQFDSLVSFSGKIMDYLSIPQRGAKVRYTLTRSQNPFYGYSRFSSPIKIQQGEVESNGEGNFSISFVPKRVQSSRDHYFIYELSIEVTSQKGETQSSSREIFVGKQSYRISTNLKGEINREELKKIEILVQNLNGKSIDKPFTYSITKIKETSPSPKEGENRRYSPSSEGASDFQRECVLFSRRMHSFFQSLEYPLAFAEQGNYLFEAFEEEECIYSQRFNLVSPKERTLAFSTIDLFKPIRTTFSPEQSAQILLGSDEREVYVFQEIILHGEQKEYSHFTLNKEQKLVNLHYKEEYGEGVVVNFFFVKRGKLYFHEVTLRREFAPKNLSFRWETFRNKLNPGAKEVWKLRITTPEGKPIQAEILATMYDKSLDALYPLRWNFAPLRRGNIPSLSLEGRIGFGNNCLNPYFTTQYREAKYPEYDHLKEIPLPNIYASIRNAKGLRLSMGAPNVVATEENAESDAMGNGEVSALRTDLRENAFFFPELLTDREGRAILQFVLPEDLTQWRLMLLAHSKEMQFVQMDTTISVHKVVMVKPHLPRFLRQGDSIVLTAEVMNRGEESRSFQCLWEIVFKDEMGNKIDTITQKTRSNIGKEESALIECPLRVNAMARSMEVSVSAVGGNYADGEKNSLPVLPSEGNYTHTQISTFSKKGEYNIALQGEEKERGELLSVEVEVISSLYQSVISSLPALLAEDSKDRLSLVNRLYAEALMEKILRENPKIGEQISSLPQEDYHSSNLNAETPWIERGENLNQQREALLQSLDSSKRRASLLNSQRELSESVCAEGGWSWVEGMKPSTFITLEILDRLSKLKKLETLSLEPSLENAIGKSILFLDKEFLRKEQSLLTTSMLKYLSIRSTFSSITMDKEHKALYKKFLGKVSQDWEHTSFQEKALRAHILWENKNSKKAKEICASIKEYATRDSILGMYWANNVLRTYSPYEHLKIHTLLMNTLQEVMPNREEEKEMKQWLLREKITQNWVQEGLLTEVCYALLEGEEHLEGKVSVSFGEEQIASPSQEYAFKRFSPQQMEGKNSLLKVIKEEDSPSFITLYYHYKQSIDKVQNEGKELKISKTILTTPQSTSGNVRKDIVLTLSAESDFDYVKVEDFLPANAEPEEQLSGMKFQGTLPYYMEVKDSQIRLFIEHLPKGEHQLVYSIFPSHKGICRTGGTKIKSLYAPQYVGIFHTFVLRE